MRVIAYPSDETGCGTYRVVLPVAAARLAGCDAHLGSEGKPGQGLPIQRKIINGRMCARPLPIDADVIVLQRPVSQILSEMIPVIQAAGVAVVVEIDDDMARMDSRHPMYGQLNPTRSPEHNWRWLHVACRLADLVTVTTPALAARYGAHGRVVVLPNRVPARLLDIERHSDGRTVGWAGWTVTHPADLRVTHGGVTAALDSTGGRFLKVGPADDAWKDLNLHAMPETTGPLFDIDDYYRALGRLDVGIVPLQDTQFNRAKSFLKGLEYQACGTPWVASPVDDYLALAAYGAGTLAKDRSRDWQRAIERLLTDETFRAEESERGREIVREHLTLEANGHLWAEAWEAATVNRRAAPAPQLAVAA
jgi:glycosyltransferase involved in cell wall biosynthesis